jgi:hypothetical protein
VAIAEQLKRLRFSARAGADSPADVAELESAAGVQLPTAYRDFLLDIGGGHLSDGLAVCTGPTPFGEHIITVLHSAREVMGLLDSTVAPRNMLCIGYGHFGRTTCLSVAGLDHGQIYSLDTEMRFFWGEDTLRNLPHLDPTIKEFFRLRDADDLPERPWGYDNCYHVADSFEEFIGKLYVVG